MKLLRQFCIIAVVSLLGEALKHFVPLPVPASVWGMVLMLTALKTGIIKLEQVDKAAKFLIEIMPVMFIPAGVGLLEAWGVLKPVFLPVAVLTVVTTVFVMAVTGRVTQGMIYLEKRKQETKE